MMSALFAVVMTVEDQPIDATCASWIDTVVDLLFSFEISVRFAVCPNRKTFFFDGYKGIDIMAARFPSSFERSH